MWWWRWRWWSRWKVTATLSWWWWCCRWNEDMKCLHRRTKNMKIKKIHTRMVYTHTHYTLQQRRKSINFFAVVCCACLCKMFCYSISFFLLLSGCMRMCAMDVLIFLFLTNAFIFILYSLLLLRFFMSTSFSIRFRFLFPLSRWSCQIQAFAMILDTKKMRRIW